jgi:hypothetical protein
VDAGLLDDGELLRTDEGYVSAVVAVQRNVGVRLMYDLTVEQIRTYYVIAGLTSVLVHNCPSDDVPASRGSTGRTTPGGDNERRAMECVQEYPQYGNRLPIDMTDSRRHGDDGWVKMEQTVFGVEIHYVYNPRTGEADVTSSTKTGASSREVGLYWWHRRRSA